MVATILGTLSFAFAPLSVIRDMAVYFEGLPENEIVSNIMDMARVVLSAHSTSRAQLSAINSGVPRGAGRILRRRGQLFKKGTFSMTNIRIIREK